MKASINAALTALVLAAHTGLILMASPAWARNPPGSGLADSPHDFTKPGNSVYRVTRDTDMCIFCHVRSPGPPAVVRPPWGQGVTVTSSTLTRSANSSTRAAPAQDAADSLPLWNHALTYASYTMYQNGLGAPTTGPKASQAIANGMTPGSISLVCLGCHDGSVAVNIIGKNHYLGNHHAIGFDYDAVRSMDREIRPAEFAYLTTSTTVRDHLYGPVKGTLECGTCHSVHNTGNSGETLLWRDNARSALCLTCHDKGTYPGLP